MITRSQLQSAQERAAKILTYTLSNTDPNKIDVFTDPRIRRIPEIAN